MSWPRFGLVGRASAVKLLCADHVNTLVIINPAAGAGQALGRWRALEQQLRDAGLAFEPVVTEQPGDALRLAAEAADRHDLVVAAGGDGTVFEVCSGLGAASNTRAALGIVPLGTGNDSARALGIRTEAEALQALRRPTPRPVDLIQMECQIKSRPARRHAFLFAAVGITGELLERTTPAVKRVFGPRWSYPVGLVRALLHYRAPWLRVTLDGRPREGRFLFVGASNSEHAGGGMRLAPGARVDDGCLDVNVIEAAGRLEALGQLRRLCQGRHVTHPKVCYGPARRIEIEAVAPLSVQADGDLVGHTPARFEVRPGALRALALREAFR